MLLDLMPMSLPKRAGSDAVLRPKLDQHHVPMLNSHQLPLPKPLGTGIALCTEAAASPSLL